MKLRVLFLILMCSLPAAAAHKASLPMALTVYSKSVSVTLTWSESSSGVDSFQVYRSTVSGGPYLELAGDVTVLSYVDTSPEVGSINYYVVTATSSTGLVSDYSIQVGASLK